MAFELDCKITHILDAQNGTSSRGPWAKQDFVVEYKDGNYPTRICLNVWGADKVKDFQRFHVGDNVKVSFNISGREYNGRWFNDLRAWRIESSNPEPQEFRTSSAPDVQSAPAPSASDFSEPAGFDTDDLPF